MRKALKLLFLLGLGYKLVYEDFKAFLQDILRGKPNVDGAIFLGTGTTEIRLALIDQLNKQSNIFMIYGGGKKKIPCDLLSINTNNIYLYSHANHLDSMSICYTAQNSAFNAIAKSINIPFYIRWLGYSGIHLKLFANYHVSPEQSSNLVSPLPLGSTLIVASTLSKVHSASDELILKAFTLYSGNPYAEYVNYIVINPGSNMFVVNTGQGQKSFTTSVNQLQKFSHPYIMDWQKEQVKKFISFFQDVADDFYGAKEKEFKVFIQQYLNVHNESLSEWFLGFQSSNLGRYKELLLFHYVTQNETEAVKALLSNSVDINNSLINGATPLYVSAHLGNIEIAKLLVNLGAHVDAATKSNKATPLMAAAINSFPDVIEFLLNAGANPNAKDVGGNTPLILAALKGHSKVAELLMKFGSDVNTVNNVGETALTLAASQGYLEVVEQLFNTEKITNINYFNQNSYTALMLASRNSNADVVKSLIAHEADINIQNDRGETALSVFLVERYVNLEEIPLKAEADMHSGHSQFALTKQKSLNTVKLLLSHAPKSLQYNTEVELYKDSITNELSKFKYDPINYILKNNHDVSETLKILHKIKSYEESYYNVQIAAQVEDCLLRLDFNKSYIDLSDMCGTTSSHEKIFLDL
ncbi:conserved hypothetical protein [Alphaproteobacteria bacterium]